MAYLTGNRSQLQLFPQGLDEAIGSDDPVRVYDAFVEQLDLAALGIEEEAEQVGPPAYAPRAMLKLLVYGYAYGIRSSRQLERATYHNVSFMWLVGGLKPDHKTIARFRQTHRGALAQVLTHCARLCLKLGLVEGNTLFVDGSKVRANAALARTWTPEKCARVLRKTAQRIDQLLAEGEAVDQAEASQGSLVHRPADLQQAHTVQAQVQTILDDLERSGQRAVNQTDRDCRPMKTRHGPMAGYNLQAVVDDQHGLWVHSTVVPTTNDLQQLVPQVQQAQARLGQPCRTVCADAGYANTQAFQTLAADQIHVVVPSQVQAHRGPPKPFGKGQFRYDAQRDTYVCPAGEVLPYRKTDRHLGTRVYQIPQAALCQRCPHWGPCTTAQSGRAIVRHRAEEVKQQFEAQFQAPAGQAIYQRRKSKVEHPFGHLKRNLGVQSFLLRGLAGVRAEASLLATAFNLRRLITLLGVAGFQERIATG